MDIYVMWVKNDGVPVEMAFIDHGSGYMLCIGTRAEVDAATPEKLERMIWESIAMATRTKLPEGEITIPSRMRQ